MNNKEPEKQQKIKNVINIRWTLLIFDLIVFAFCAVALYFLSDRGPFPIWTVAISACFVFLFRFVFRIYSQIWRYGGVQSFLKLLLADALACLCSISVNLFIPDPRPRTAEVIAIVGIDLLFAIGARLIYNYLYKHRAGNDGMGKASRAILRLFGLREEYTGEQSRNKINIAIVGAGNDGTALATALINDDNSQYKPKLFIDIKKEKIGRSILDINVISEEQVTKERIEADNISEIVFAVPEMSVEDKKAVFDKYKNFGCRLKVYEKSALLATENPNKIRLREFEIEDLLFRKNIRVTDEKTAAYYRDKVVLVTGGGGSIGSELCRQIASMKPRTLVILDVYENGAYDLQQELLRQYKDTFEIKVEICSVCNTEAIEKVFRAYQPQIVLHAAAHKHVPLMEKNCVEAVDNNVFGTYNVIKMTEKYKAERFIMISTDKAVNPTNVMGATKRMCEMITQYYSTRNNGTVYSATRFGNVLGSAGSVIPLFKRQISTGGPITITDKRINRFFMTIPEASQLVLQSGTMAKNGELFVLDMGQPVKILDLAENMIKLSGYIPYKDIDIVETGLRPGEKLYEELLVKTEELDKTENSMIFIERDAPLTEEQLNEKLALLREAVQSGDDEEARHALMTAVPTYKRPEEVNSKYEQTTKA